MTLRRLILAILRRFAWVVCFILPIQKNKVVFSSYYGKGYGDNPKAIAERLRRENGKLQLVWLVKDAAAAATIPSDIKCVYYDSPMAPFHLATARVWVDNCRKAYWYKKKGQYYLHTWHGLGIKKVEADVEDKLGEGYVKIAKKDSKAIDAIVSEGVYMSKIYQTAFWYNGPVLEWGSPRNDVVLDPEESQKAEMAVRNAYGLQRHEKVVLYAPTFRKDQSLEPYSLDWERLKNACQARFGGEFRVMVRLHPNISAKSHLLRIGPDVIDATGYGDMQELLACADVVVSDYSTLMIDFSLSGKPCFRYAVDIEEYKKDRDFYFDLEKIPYPLGRSNDEFEKILLNFDADAYDQALRDFLSEIGIVRDGNSAKRCAELICQLCGCSSVQQ